MQFNLSAFKAFTLICASALIVSSCKKSEDAPQKIDDPIYAPYGKLQVRFANEVDGQPVSLGAIANTNAAGNKYSVDLLKYYVTNFTLVKEDGTEKNFKNYNLIDASDSASTHFTLDSVINGAYTSVKFYIGVDADRNHTGAQEGALDPINGMIWTWNTGYIFFKHEGNFKDSTGATKSLLFHLGTDRGLSTITVPVSKFEVKGNAKTLYLKFNLNKLYAAPNKIDFNYDNSHMSTDRNDAFWISAMTGNMPNAFLFDKVQ